MTSTIAIEHDDLFVYAPSYLAWERGLTEGKAVGTAPEVDLVLLDKDKTLDAFIDPEGFSAARKSGVTVGKRNLQKVQQRVEVQLNKLIFDYQAKKLDEKALRQEATKLMKVAWRDVFLAGVRASGIAGTGPGSKKPLVQLGPDDEKWLKGAMSHEMRFLNGLLTAVIEETWKMPLPRRVKMYVDALDSFYNSARVIGLPATIKIHWLPKKHKIDDRTCAGCKYLIDNSPYSKKTLPTTPRSGLTPCLTNCRDYLLVRMTTQEEAIALHQSSPTRGTHIKKLRRIKRLGYL